MICEQAREVGIEFAVAYPVSKRVQPCEPLLAPTSARACFIYVMF